MAATCGNVLCDANEVNAGTKFLSCGGCLSLKYCSEKCQRADWGAHKQTCKTIQTQRIAVEHTTPFQISITKHTRSHRGDPTWTVVKQVLEEEWNKNPPTDVMGMVRFTQLTSEAISKKIGNKKDWDRAMLMCASVLQECIPPAENRAERVPR